MERLFRKNERYTSLNSDICNFGAIKKCVESFRPNRIINLAAETHVDRSIAKPDAFLETNIIGTKTLLSCAEAYYASLNYNQQSDFKFIQVSTDEVYGS